MQANHSSAPAPDLRIVPIESVQAHEEHDEQRSAPLVERLRNEQFMINPPLVAPIGATQYVILDGANRCHSFMRLEYPHILIQVVNYNSGYVDLSTWNHIVSGWDKAAFLHELEQLPDIGISEGQAANAIAHIIFRDGLKLVLHAPVATTMERNASLRHFVRVYQQNATLYRTAINEPDELWLLYPDAIALVLFPQYFPADIIAAAKYKAYLPPGISRHIVHGRALRVNYPLDELRDTRRLLREKNARLQEWMQDKLSKRQLRYYAEATYQFDE